MKILAIGSTQGDIHIVNEYIDKSGADIVVCTGDFGIFYRSPKNLPKSFYNNYFYEYLEGKKKFIKPVFTIRGVHDNISLCKKIYTKQIIVDNFNIIESGTNSFIKDGQHSYSVGGVGGSYSPKHYNKEKLIGKNNRHFTKFHIESLKNINITFLLMHDVIGESSKKQVMFSEEMYSFIEEVMPFYCLIGKYNWWGHSKLCGSNLIFLPYASKGYLMIDTENWDAAAVRLDIGGIIGK